MLVSFGITLMLAISLALANPDTAMAAGYGADGHYYTDAEIEAIIYATWPADAAPYAVVIAERESGLVPQITNSYDGDAFCLFQITDIVEAQYGISEAYLDTPYECSAFAAALYYDQGWDPWAETAY